METSVELAPRLTTRPATLNDAVIVTERAAACELAEDSVVEVDPDDIRSDLAHPDLDLSRDTHLAFEGERLVAWSLVVHPRAVWADVHPEHRGRGIGSAILLWSEARSREAGLERIGQTVTDEQPEPEMPAGIEVRTYRPGVDDEATYLMIQDAFEEWPDHERASMDVWRGLSTNSYTGALGMYERVGMRVRRSYTRYAKSL